MLTPVSTNEELGYSQVVRSGNLLFVSGQVSVDERGNLVGRGDIRTQAEQVFANLRRVLEISGSGMDRVLKFTVFVTHMDYLPVLRELRKRIYGPLGYYPASTALVVMSLVRPEWLVEIDAVAVAREG